MNGEDGDRLYVAVPDCTPRQIARACIARFAARRRRMPTEGELVAEAARLSPPYTLKTSTAGFHLRAWVETVPNRLGTDA